MTTPADKPVRYPEDKAHVRWQFNGVACSIVRHPSIGHLCGYVRFPKRPVREQGDGGILNYVQVHGGITFADESLDGSMVYGFDCGHCDDAVAEEHWPDYMRDRPDLFARGGHVWTDEEVRAEVEKMAMFIVAAAKYEEAYLLAPDDKAKAEILDDYFKETGGHNIMDNFGAQIRVLFGGPL